MRLGAIKREEFLPNLTPDFGRRNERRKYYRKKRQLVVAAHPTEALQSPQPGVQSNLQE
jgi:hypothetical protein